MRNSFRLTWIMRPPRPGSWSDAGRQPQPRRDPGPEERHQESPEPGGERGASPSPAGEEPLEGGGRMQGGQEGEKAQSRGSGEKPSALEQRQGEDPQDPGADEGREIEEGHDPERRRASLPAAQAQEEGEVVTQHRAHARGRRLRRPPPETALRQQTGDQGLEVVEEADRGPDLPADVLEDVGRAGIAGSLTQRVEPAGGARQEDGERNRADEVSGPEPQERAQGAQRASTRPAEEQAASMRTPSLLDASSSDGHSSMSRTFSTSLCLRT